MNFAESRGIKHADSTRVSHCQFCSLQCELFEFLQIDELER
jgi:hypothetical protein